MVESIPGFEALRLKYLSQLAERQEAIRGYISELHGAGHAADEGNLRGAHSLLHQISGNAGSFGFAALGAAARICDETIFAHLENGTALSDAQLEQIKRTGAVFDRECTAALGQTAG